MKLLRALVSTALFSAGILYSNTVFANAWSATDLGPISGCPSRHGFSAPRSGTKLQYVGLNNKGWVAEGRFIYGVDGPGSVAEIAIPDAVYICSTGMNTSGQVTGFAINSKGEEQPFITGPMDDGVSPIGTSHIDIFPIITGLAFGWSGGINDFGQTVVSASAQCKRDTNKQCIPRVWINNAGNTISDRDHLFIVNSAGEVTEINASSGSTGIAINEAAQVLGWDGSRAFLTGPNGQGSKSLGRLSNGGGINDAGEVAIGGVPGGVFSEPAEQFGINNAKQVIGESLMPRGHALITGPNYEGVTDINALVQLDDGAYISTPVAINESGEFVAAGSDDHLYLLSPYRSPSVDPAKNNGCPCDEADTPFPINARTGNKYLGETDYAAPEAAGLRFVRQYNSQGSGFSSHIGAGWTHNYNSSVSTGKVNWLFQTIVTHADGRASIFSPGRYPEYVAADADTTGKLISFKVADGDGWQFTDGTNDAVSTYDGTGRLVSIRERNGQTQTMAYSTSTTPAAIAPRSNLLIAVTDAFGRQLRFSYDSASRINSMTDPAGQSYRYNYDANGNLASVTYPDNKIKSYHYNEPQHTTGTPLPHAITGITDENGARHADYHYDAQGRAYLETHAGGVDRFSIVYGDGHTTTTVTDPQQTSRTFGLETVLGVVKTTGYTQPAGAGSAPATSAVTHDAQGNVTSRVDLRGTTTVYTYDLARNLETGRVEALGAAEARTITTTWHPSYRLPTMITEPKRLTLMTYDTSGNLLSKSIQSTSDANGAQGIAAQVTGKPRTWRYSYSGLGQVLTATGPRTDAANVTRYAYDTQGNLASVTNAAGHVTTRSNYDANGRPGLITAPNGARTELSYSPRGWLAASDANGERTTYTYDGVGQMTRLTRPDGSAIQYTYDDAHRLTAVSDGLGNRISYVLDAAGNRVGEQVYDPTGALSKQATRVFDALNRLQQQTGAIQ